MPKVLLRAPDMKFPHPWDFAWRLTKVGNQISASNPYLFSRGLDVDMDEAMFKDQLLAGIRKLSNECWAKFSYDS